MSPGFLVLEKGPVFEGLWCGGQPRAGEVVFNTAHNGYEEIATDPSYYGQIIVMCAPQQGNYGIDDNFWESRRLWIQGFVCLEMEKPGQKESSWFNRLDGFKIPSMEGVDTRSLTLFLRQRGTCVGALVPGPLEEAQVLSKKLIAEHRDRGGDWAYEVSRTQVDKREGFNSKGPRVAVVDYGCKENILRLVQKRSCEVWIFPSRTQASEILDSRPHGVVLSNGPGDPRNVEQAVDTVSDLLGKKPLFGICMGHQILALALGGKTRPLLFGHRGINHPVKNMCTGEVFVTSQNHGYVVDPESLPRDVTLTYRNLNDNSLSGLEWAEKKCLGVQFHPESHPGPRDGEKIFDQFFNWMDL